MQLTEQELAKLIENRGPYPHYYDQATLPSIKVSYLPWQYVNNYYHQRYPDPPPGLWVLQDGTGYLTCTESLELLEKTIKLYSGNEFALRALLGVKTMLHSPVQIEPYKRRVKRALTKAERATIALSLEDIGL